MALGLWLPESDFRRSRPRHDKERQRERARGGASAPPRIPRPIFSITARSILCGRRALQLHRAQSVKRVKRSAGTVDKSARSPPT